MSSNYNLWIKYIFTKWFKLSQNYIVSKIHYYNKDLKKIEELFLIKNKNKNYLYPYFWDCQELKSIKPFELANFCNIIELKFLESSNNTLKDSLNMERILVDNDSIIIFK